MEIKTSFYTTRAILNLFNNALKVNEERILLDIKGLYIPGNGNEYRGFYYDQLFEEGTESNLTLIVPAIIRQKLTPEKVIKFNGFITRRVDDKGNIKLNLNLSELYDQVAPQFSERDSLSLDIQRAKSNLGYRDLEDHIKRCIIEDRKPKIIALIGSTSIIDKDILHALGETINFFDPTFIRVNMSVASHVAMALKQIDSESDVIVISRGGGENLEVFNNLEIARIAIMLKPIVVTAIGHREDVSLLDKVADRSFSTPTALGGFLRELYNLTIDEINKSKSEVIASVESSLRKAYSLELNSLKEIVNQKDRELAKSNEMRILEQKKNKTFLTMLILLGIAIGFMLARLLFNV